MRSRYRLSDLPLRGAPFSRLPYARGHLEVLWPESERDLHVIGWMSAPGDRLEHVEVYFDAEYSMTTPIMPRPDVQSCFPWYPFGDATGFDFHVHLDRKAVKKTTRLDLVGCTVALPKVRLSQLVRTDLDALPSPPVEYMQRVAHMVEPHSFKVEGFRTVGAFLEALSRNANLADVHRMLDWGCGCGRMSMWLLAADDCPELYGCDTGAFAVLDPMPPTPYPSEWFDLIVSYSVFTHLTRDVQIAWFEEMRRILAPGGIFLASVHGQLAYDFACGQLTSAFPEAGIVDATLDPALDAIAPSDYYRATYQGRQYTERVFGQYFDILEFVYGGAINQDLAVMRKKR